MWPVWTGRKHYVNRCSGEWMAFSAEYLSSITCFPADFNPSFQAHTCSILYIVTWEQSRQRLSLFYLPSWYIFICSLFYLNIPSFFETLSLILVQWVSPHLFVKLIGGGPSLGPSLYKYRYIYELPKYCPLFTPFPSCQLTALRTNQAPIVPMTAYSPPIAAYGRPNGCTWTKKIRETI